MRISNSLPTRLSAAQAPQAACSLRASEVGRLHTRPRDGRKVQRSCEHAQPHTEIVAIFGQFPFVTPFVAADTPAAIRELSPPVTTERVLKELATLSAAQVQTLWTTNPETIRRALGWFGDRLEELRRNTVLRRQLSQLHIWPSGTGLHPLGRLVMPGGFHDNLGLAQLLDSKLVQEHGDLLRLLEAPILTIQDYVTKHVPKAFAGGAKPPDSRLRVLADLLASHMNDFRDMPEAQKALADCRIVECVDDGQFRKAVEVYFLAADAATILGRSVPAARVPQERPEAMRQLLEWLGVASRPRTKDVLDRVAELTANPPTPASREAIHRVLTHLIDRWPDEKNQDRWKELCDRAWLLAQGDDAQWYRPRDLHAIYSHHLFYRSQARFIDLEPNYQNQRVGRDLLDFLGVQTGDPPVKLVVRHLLACAKASEKVNNQVWPFLDRNSEEPEIEQLRGQSCLLLDDGSYVSPETVFLKDPCLGRFARQVNGDTVPYKNLLKRLNVRELPGPADAIRVLCDINKQFSPNNEPIHDVNDHNVLWYCWKLLNGADDSLLKDLRGKKVILNSENVLLSGDIDAQ